MAFQSTVRRVQTSGVIGDLAFTGPLRSKSYTIVSASAANNIVGRVFTESAEGIAQAGGTGFFAGVFFDSKNLVSYGGAGGPLSPTLTVENYTQGEMLSMGEVFVNFVNLGSSGDVVSYDTTTGELHIGAPIAGQLAVPNATVSYYDVTALTGANGVLKLTN